MGRALRSARVDHVIGTPAGLALARLVRLPGTRIAAGASSRAGRRALGARRTLADLARLGRTSAAAPEPCPDAECAVVFTSGATGPPKGVVYRHRQVRAQLELLRSTYALTDADRFVAAFAPFALLGPALGIGSATPDVDVTAPQTLTAATLAEAVEAVDATVVFASPAALRGVLASAGGPHAGTAGGARRGAPADLGGGAGPGHPAARRPAGAAGRSGAHAVRDDRGDAGHRHLPGTDRGGRSRQRGVRRPATERCRRGDQPADRPGPCRRGSDLGRRGDRRDVHPRRAREGPLRRPVGDRAAQLPEPGLAPHRRRRPPRRHGAAVDRGPARAPDRHRPRRRDTGRTGTAGPDAAGRPRRSRGRRRARSGTSRSWWWSCPRAARPRTGRRPRTSP